MPRKTKRTLRRMQPTTKEVVKVANELDRMSRRLMKLSEKIAQYEQDSDALGNYMASLKKATQ